MPYSVYTQVYSEHEHSTHLGFNPSKGWLGPGETADVQVQCVPVPEYSVTVPMSACV